MTSALIDRADVQHGEVALKGSEQEGEEKKRGVRVDSSREETTFSAPTAVWKVSRMNFRHEILITGVSCCQILTD